MGGRSYLLEHNGFLLSKKLSYYAVFADKHLYIHRILKESIVSVIILLACMLSNST